MTDIKLGVVGCSGRMGRTLMRLIAEADGLALAGGTERPGHAALGEDLGTLAGAAALGLAVTDDAAALFATADVVLDFTVPAASLAHAALAADTGTALVLGTTGFAPEEQAAVAAAAERAAIMQAGNMSLGVNLLVELTRQVAAALDESFDIEVLEVHHRHKVDAPSGTALMLGRAAAEGRGVAHEGNTESGRDGITGARKSGAIGYAALRGGAVVGEHTVLFAGPEERIELVHRASDRALFARGALTAARWLVGRPAGLYSMKDVLGL